MDSSILKLIFAVAMIIVGSVGIASFFWNTEDIDEILFDDVTSQKMGNALNSLTWCGLILIILSSAILAYRFPNPKKYNKWYEYYMAACTLIGIIFLIASITVFDSVDPDKLSEDEIFSLRDFGGVLIVAGSACTSVGLYFLIFMGKASPPSEGVVGDVVNASFDFEF